MLDDFGVEDYVDTEVFHPTTGESFFDEQGNYILES
jgi:hypothetical protein